MTRPTRFQLIQVVGYALVATLALLSLKERSHDLLLGTLLLLGSLAQPLRLPVWLPAALYAVALLYLLPSGPELLARLCGLAALLAWAWYSTQTQRERRWMHSNIQALEAGSARLSQAGDPDHVIGAGAQMLGELQVAPHFAIIAYRQGTPAILGGGGAFLPWVGQALTPDVSAHFSMQADHWVVGEAMKLLPADLRRHHLLIGISAGASQELGLLLLTRSERPFNSSEQLGAQAFARLLGAQLGQLLALQELREANELTLRSLGAALEQRDNETSGHTLRVVGLSVRLAEQLGWNAERIQALRWGAYLHDLGKIAIPDAILYKAGRLNDLERQEMQTHPQLGYEMLQDLHFLPAETLAVVRYHHERWDGKGYPAGLRGQDIPEAARIFALVDVYDALTHTRAYKQAWTQQEALEEIVRQSGTHFDPNFVAAFCQMLGNDAELMVTA